MWWHKKNPETFSTGEGGGTQYENMPNILLSEDMPQSDILLVWVTTSSKLNPDDWYPHLRYHKTVCTASTI